MLGVFGSGQHRDRDRSAFTEIVVSSGGMYNTAFPKWEDATSTGARVALRSTRVRDV